MHSQQMIPIPCFLVNNLTNDSLEQCKFILDNDCLEDDAAIDYVHLVYCEFGHELRYASIILLVFLMIVLFLALSSIADEFLCPSLLAVAKSLRMSDSLAGVTLLAFGNGCPDIFSSIAAASDDRPELIVGELLGAGIFCTSIVSGLIFIHSDFKLACRPLLRDTTFYLFAVYLMWSFCWDQQITFYGSLAFILIYVIYLVVALTGQAIYSRALGEYPIADSHQANLDQQRHATPNNHHDDDDDEKQESWFLARDESLRLKKIKNLHRQHEQQQQQQENIKINNKGENNCSTIYVNYESTNPSRFNGFELESNESDCSQIVSVISKKRLSQSGGAGDWKKSSISVSPLVNLEITKQAVVKLEQQQQQQHHHHQQRQQPRTSLEKTNSLIVEDLANGTEWDQFLDRINPIKTDEWPQTSLIGKVAALLGAPLLFVALLTVPVVDSERKNNNWCRPLNVLHCITVPLTISLCFLKFGPDNEYLSLFEIPIPVLILIPATCLAAMVYRTSRQHAVPTYHSAFAYCGFFMSVLWIYTLAGEIISLLKTIGIMFSMSDTAIGLGVLAWGNSLGDIVANLSLAEAGYPRMAIGAAIGAPLLNLLLGFGISLTLNLKPGQTLPFEYSPTITLLCSTLAIILLSLMLSTLAPANKSKKPFGYLLIGCYFVYFIIAVCLEYNFIKFD